MFEYPLIRFDNRKWLEKLQEGQLYMRPSIFYQQLEDDGEVRSDPYDGSIPLADEKRIMERISGKDTFRERIVLFNRYVKCFYHCSKENLIYSNEPQVGDDYEGLERGEGSDSEEVRSQRDLSPVTRQKKALI